VEFVAEGLDADADEGGKRVGFEALRDLFGGGERAGVFFGIGACAVAVLEVDAEVFDGFAREFFEDAGVDGVSEPGWFGDIAGDAGMAL